MNSNSIGLQTDVVVYVSNDALIKVGALVVFLIILYFFIRKAAV